MQSYSMPLNPSIIIYRERSFAVAEVTSQVRPCSQSLFSRPQTTEKALGARLHI